MKNGMARRDFLRYAALATAGVVTGCAAPPTPVPPARTTTSVPPGAPHINASQAVVPTVASPSVNPTATSGAQATATGPVIRYVPGSTIKLEQLLGEEGKERHQPTTGDTTWRQFDLKTVR
jgi:FtsP/CotA-like multicopper oxidase with cupredoxin domain